MRRLVGIAVGGGDAAGFEDEAFVRFAEGLGFDCAAVAGDPVRDARVFREWVGQCHGAGCAGFVVLDDAAGLCGMTVFGLTHLPVLRVTPTATVAVSHVPAVGSLEQAMLFLSRHGAASSVEEKPVVATKKVVMQRADAAEDAVQDTLSDEADLGRLNRAFADKQWLHGAGGGEAALVDPTEAAARPANVASATLDYTPAVRAATVLARHLALRDGATEVSGGHLFEAFLGIEGCAAAEVVCRLSDNPEGVYRVVSGLPRVNLKAPVALLALAAETMECVQTGKATARREGRCYLDTLDVVGALAQRVAGVSEMLERWGISAGVLAAREFVFEIPDEYAPVREEEEWRERIRPRKPLSTREMSAMMHTLPPHLVPGAQPMPTQKERPVRQAPVVGMGLAPAAGSPKYMSNESIRRFDPDNAALDLVEETCDAFLAGKVVGMTTDTTYVLAVDATNAKAVERLRTIKPPTDDAPMGVLFDTLSALEAFVLPLSPAARRLAAAGWPGAMALKLPRKGAALRHVGDASGIWLRQPSFYAILAFLSMIGRPLAVMDSGCENANEVRKKFAGMLDRILDAGVDGSGAEVRIDATGEDAPRVVFCPKYVPPRLKECLESMNIQEKSDDEKVD